MTMTEHEIVIAGAGPTGLMLAAELALAGIDVALVERRTSQELVGSRAGGLHARTIELLDQRGIADRFLAEGKVAQVAGFAWIALDITDLPTRYNHGLALWQKHVERILAGWVNELNVPIYRGIEVVGFEQDVTSVEVALSGGGLLRAQYLVGCDGGRSLIRRAAGIEFPGWGPTISHLIAEVELLDEPQWGMRRDDSGFHGLSKLEDGKTVRVLVTEPRVTSAGQPTLRDLSEILIAVYGTDYGVHSPTSISRFTDMTRQAAAYRERRVLLAGDAAHIHYPVGGQGLNIGMEDAVNLGWKLAQVVKHISAETLLDTYHSERHPVAVRALRNTRAQIELIRRSNERIDALREILDEILHMDEPRRRIGAMMSGLDTRYNLGEGHPLLGRRMPDLELVTSDGLVRTFTLLHDARPVLLNFTDAGAFDVTPWADRVRSIDAKYVGSWELPGVGAVSAPNAVLIRPDGYVAWVADVKSDAGLEPALTRWFGPPKYERVPAATLQQQASCASRLLQQSRASFRS